MAPRHVYLRGIYRQVPSVSVAGRWQLASRWCLLQITCQPDASKGVHKYGNHWASFCHPASDRLRRKILRVFGPPDFGPGVFRLFGSIKNHLNGKLFTTDVDVK